MSAGVVSYEEIVMVSVDDQPPTAERIKAAGLVAANQHGVSWNAGQLEVPKKWMRQLRLHLVTNGFVSKINDRSDIDRWQLRWRLPWPASFGYTPEPPLAGLGQMNHALAAGLNQLAEQIHEHHVAQGHYARETLGTIPAPVYHVPSADPLDRPQIIVNPSLVSEKLLLIVSEVAEAQDKVRDGDDDGEALEIIDVIIRALDYCGWRDINVEAGLAIKLQENKSRPKLHGRKDF